MGLHFSRLALAVALSMQLVAPLHAAEQLDEFYIEIKGPDKTAPTLMVPETTQPMAAPVKSQVESAPARAKPVVKRAKPTMKVGVPEPFVEAAVVDDSASAGVYGPVKNNDTLWSIAQQVRPSSQVSVHQTMLAIYRKNPQAFAGGKLNGLYRGARLTLPTQEQIRAESEAQAQQLMRNGRLTLTARTPTKPATTSTVVDVTNSATPKATRVIKLSPSAESAVEPAPTQEAAKPVVKLTPTNPGVSAPEPAATAAEPVSSPVATVAPQQEDVVSNKLVIQSEPLAASMAQPTSSAQTSVDASVSALVASATSGAVSATDPNWQQAYQGKIDELTKSNGQLESQVSQLTQDVAQLKALLTSQVSAAQAASPAAVSTPSEAQSADAEPAASEEGFWSQLVSTPLNLGLMLALPFLLALALVSLWLMARSKRDQAARELEDAESAEMMMAHGDSHFDHLLAADMVAMSDLPDLDQLDETVQPQPEIVLSERKEPAFTIPTSFALNESAKTTSSMDSELVPELSESDLDLSVPTAQEQSEPAWPADFNEPLDESEFLSELGVSETQSQPVVTDAMVAESHPLVPDAVAVTDEHFEPREEVNLSNDELEALFDSADELEDEPFAPVDGKESDAELVASLESESEELESDDVALDASLEELSLELEHRDAAHAEPLRAAEEDAPVADWYNEEPIVDLSAPVAADDIDALLAQSASASQPSFKAIDELLAEAEESSEKDEPYQGLSLDVGLDEFPEVLPTGEGVDVDLDSELGAKLDLARAYLEIDDKASAVELLNEVLASGSSVQKDEAQRLPKRLA